MRKKTAHNRSSTIRDEFPQNNRFLTKNLHFAQELVVELSLANGAAHKNASVTHTVDGPQFNGRLRLNTIISERSKEEEEEAEMRGLR